MRLPSRPVPLVVFCIAALAVPSLHAEEPNRVERTAKKAGAAVDATAQRAEKWAARTTKRTAKAVGHAADKTESWIKKKTE